MNNKILMFPGLSDTRELRKNQFLMLIRKITPGYFCNPDQINPDRIYIIRATGSSSFNEDYPREIAFSLDLENGKIDVVFTLYVNNQKSLETVRGGARTAELKFSFSCFSEETVEELKGLIKKYTDNPENITAILCFKEEKVLVTA